MSLGNIELQLGLNTSPATAALQQYYQKLNQGAQQAARSQKPVETALGKLVESARKLGFTYDKTSKTFKDFKGNATSINTVKKRVDDLNASLAKTGAVAKGALGGIGAGFKQVLQGIPQGIGLAIGQQLLAPLTNFQQVVGGAVKGAVDGFVDIDRQLRQTLSISGESANRFGELAKAMNELAAQTKFTAGELSEASVQLARAGFSVDEIKEALPGIAQGAAAAGESMEGMSDVVIAALGGFQISTSETTDVVDVLTAAANSSNTSVVELGEGLKYVGPIAKNLGLTFEDTAAVAAVLANNGIKASQMGTALRQGLQRLGTAAAGTEAAMGDLSRGTANQAEVLSRLGVELQTAEGTLVPFPELLKRLRDGFANLDSLEQGQAAKILFGTESATAFISLLNTSSQEIERFFETTNNATGTAAETAKQNLAGISGSLDLLRSAFDSASATVGKFISIVLKPLVDGITAVINVFNNLPEPVQGAIVGFTALGAAITVAAGAYALFKAALATEAIQQLGVFLGTAAQSFTALGLAIKTQAIAGLTAAKTSLLAFNAQMTASISLSAVFSGAVGGIKAALAAMVAAIQGFSIQGFITGLVNGFTSIGAAAAGAGKAVIGFLAAAAPVASVAAAVGAVALVWDTYAQTVKGANEVNAEAETISKDLAAQMNELGLEVAAVNDEWERSKERVGGFQATLDILRKGLGLTTAEAVQLDKTTIELANSYGAIGDNVQSLIVDYNEQQLALQGLTEGTDEYKEAAQTLADTEKAIEDAIEKSLKKLVDRKNELIAGRDATKDLSEEEQRLLTVLNSLIGGFKAQGQALAALRPEIDATTESQKKLNAAMSAKEEAKAAGEAYDKVKEDFEGTMKAMEQAFSNMKDKLKEGLDNEVADIKRGVNEIKSEVASIERATRSQISGIKETAKAQADATRKIIASLKEESAARQAQIRANAAAATANIRSQIKAVDSGLRADLSALDERSRASAKASAARINAIDTVTNANIAANQKAANDFRKQTENEIRATRQAAEASARRFDQQKQDAQRAHDSIMRNYDAQLAAIQRAKDATNSQYDAALDALAELTPAEQQLARIEEARLRRAAQQGGEEGLRAQAQLERAEREKQADELREQRAQALAALEAQAEAVKEQRRAQELQHEAQLQVIDENRQKAQLEFARREEEIQIRAEERLEQFAAKEEAIRAQGARAKQAEQEAEAARQEEIIKEREKLEEEAAKKREELEKRLEQVQLQAEKKIAAEKAKTAKAIKKAQEEQEKRDKEIAEKIKALEQEIQNQKERARKAEEAGDKAIAKAKETYKKRESQAENEFANARNELLRSYNEAIGRSSNYIIEQGAYAWRVYANNAIQELARVQAAAVRAAQAAARAKSAASSSGSSTSSTASGGGVWTGGPVSGGTPYTVNEYGQEAFLSRSGDLSLINAPAWGTWRPKTDGTVLPANVTAGLNLPKEGVKLGKGPATTAAAQRSSAAGGPSLAAVVRAIQEQRAGDAITNNVTIQAANTTQAASDMLVDLTRIKHRRMKR